MKTEGAAAPLLPVPLLCSNDGLQAQRCLESLDVFLFALDIDHYLFLIIFKQ